ncbi:hypothetical protein, partial [Deinococcus sp.]|uniref:hypothetical protein n=1 Tax=Deinococcus sp. TaxID=47478 RepID=UPI00286993A0
MRRVIFLMALMISVASAAALPTIEQFKKSGLFKKFTLANSDNWKLNTGGKNYIFNFKHNNGI